MGISNKKELKQIVELNTTTELKDFLIQSSNHVNQFYNMLQENDKNSKQYLERYFVINHNAQYKSILVLKELIALSETNITELERIFNKSKKHIAVLSKLLETDNLIDTRKLHFSVSNCLKLKASEYQWKSKDYSKIFNDSVNFVMDFDNTFYFNIRYNTTEKDAILEELKESLVDYSYDFNDKSIKEFNKYLVDTSRDLGTINTKLLKVSKGLPLEFQERLKEIDIYKKNR